MVRQRATPKAAAPLPAAGTPEDGARPCAVCGRPAAEAYRPFCSKRCADVDLNRWLSGIYAVPAHEDEPGPGDDSDRDSE